MKGILHLLPVPLGDSDPASVLTRTEIEVLPGINHYVVENSRSARRFLSQAGLKGRIEGLNFYELNEHSDASVVSEYVELLENGNDVGLISEAGLPAVADPGSLLVAAAHAHGIKVVPYPGPSSLMMALMASGLNGQSFAFAGYIPVKPDERKARIRSMEKLAFSGQTQIMIETPYRNDSLFSDILSVCRDDLRVTVAADLTLPEEYIETRTVAMWKKKRPVIGKRPAVFLMGI